MKLIPYNPVCHEAGWPLATVTLRVTTKEHDVDPGDPHSCCAIVREHIVHTYITTMTIALPQWLVHDGEVNPDYLDCERTLYNCEETKDLYEGWTEPITARCREAGFCGDCDVADFYEVLSIQPIRDEEDN